MASRISPTAAASMWLAASAIVATRATAMPQIPKVLPALAVSCLLSPARASTKRRAETMYAPAAAVCSVTVSAPGEHAEHAAGHGETAEDVDAGDEDRDEGQHVHCGVAVAELEQGADDDDPGDRIGDAHQRRVQGVVHRPDDVEPDHDGEREHRQVTDQRVRREPGHQ